jgi:putative ABC transport system permease protein
VLRILSYEHAMLAFLSSLMAVLFAEAAAWLICRNVFDIAYQPHWHVAALTVLSSIILLVLIGLASSVGIVRQRPAVYLQQQNSV